MASDTKAAGLRAAARKARKEAASWGRVSLPGDMRAMAAVETVARWCEREARKLERAKEGK